jgi:hypothetical protein
MSFTRMIGGVIAALLALLSSAAAQDLPPDVKAYAERRAGCNYWPSEPAYDKTRKAEIQRNIRELRCETLVREEAKLNARYRGQPTLLEAIANAHDAMPD